MITEILVHLSAGHNWCRSCPKRHFRSAVFRLCRTSVVIMFALNPVMLPGQSNMNSPNDLPDTRSQPKSPLFGWLSVIIALAILAATIWGVLGLRTAWQIEDWSYYAG